MADKLKLEDVVKLIRNLESGEYLKGTGSLVSDDGKNFCCLGVWADQHGCVWHTNKVGGLVPMSPNNKRPKHGQSCAVLELGISFGVSIETQTRLASLNDGESEDCEDWGPVIDYLKNTVLPTAE